MFASFLRGAHRHRFAQQAAHQRALIASDVVESSLETAPAVALHIPATAEGEPAAHDEHKTAPAVEPVRRSPFGLAPHKSVAQ